MVANYSRLVIDLNRRPKDLTVIPPISDGILIPGNLSLPQADRDARGYTFHAPYHQAIEELIARRSANGACPVFFGIHSFTPSFHGTPRPWHAGVLWDRDPRIAGPLLDKLKAMPDICVGDNEPYSGRHPHDYTIDHHAEPGGLPHVGIEIRQDLIDQRDGAEAWAERLYRGLKDVLADPALYSPLQQRSR